MPARRTSVSGTPAVPSSGTSPSAKRPSAQGSGRGRRAAASATRQTARRSDRIRRPARMAPQRRTGVLPRASTLSPRCAMRRGTESAACRARSCCCCPRLRNRRRRARPCCSPPPPGRWAVRRTPWRRLGSAGSPSTRARASGTGGSCSTCGRAANPSPPRQRRRRRPTRPLRPALPPADNRCAVVSRTILGSFASSSLVDPAEIEENLHGSTPLRMGGRPW